VNNVRLCSRCFTEVIYKNNSFICPQCDRNVYNNYIEVDELCVNVIQWLNRNDFKTCVCCEGHYINKPIIALPYIGFDHVFSPTIFENLSKHLCIAKVEISEYTPQEFVKWSVHFTPMYNITYANRFVFNLWKVNLWNQLTDYFTNDKIPWHGEICKICYNSQRIAWRTNDEIWETVVPSVLQNYTICLDCFLNLADSKNIKIDKKDIEIIDFV